MLPTNTFNPKITEIENKTKTDEGKIPDIGGLAAKTSVSGLASKTKLNVENKISDANAFVKKKQIMLQKLVE